MLWLDCHFFPSAILSSHMNLPHGTRELLFLFFFDCVLHVPVESTGLVKGWQSATTPKKSRIRHGFAHDVEDQREQQQQHGDHSRQIRFTSDTEEQRQDWIEGAVLSMQEKKAAAPPPPEESGAGVQGGSNSNGSSTRRRNFYCEAKRDYCSRSPASTLWSFTHHGRKLPLSLSLSLFVQEKGEIGMRKKNFKVLLFN